jgi:mannose-6-phosphate isomerase
VRRLALRYPSDPGVVGALLLDHVRLGPGEGLFLPAGHVHAYLRGAAVEIMASSDNVLRCGLTTKHVDVEELLRIARFEPAEAAVLRPREVARGAATWDAPAEEFALARVDLDGAFTYDGRGPAVVLCTDGALTATASGSLALSKGSAAFVAADDGRYTLEGRGRAYVATVPA